MKKFEFENLKNLTPVENHNLLIRRRLLIASTAFPLGALLRHSTSMAQNNVLPPITITAPSPPDFNFGDFNIKPTEIYGATPGTGIPSPTVCFNKYCTSNYMLHFANMGNMIRATEMFLKHLEVFGKGDTVFWRNQIAVVGGFTPWLALGGYKHLPGANQYGFNFEPGKYANITALFGIYIGQSSGIPPTQTFESYGNPLMFIEALNHWIHGNGSQRTIHIESLNLRMAVQDFAEIRRAIENPGYGPGTYSFDTGFSTNIFNHGTKDLWSASVFGRVSGRVRGTLELLEDDTYRFVGYYSLNPDRFDADPSNRPFLQEAATTFLSKLGAVLGHKDYQINFFGEKSLSFSGQRPVKNAGTRPPQAVHRPSLGGLMRPIR
ncbi:lipid II-degrading bacteriocin [Burkholderia cepacia]|uniref:lipid II-degrading bacteriocin n=1 Tax=Burkholderia cepacia TaxID=292 RepID=UPI0013F3A943|nr:lipid II-degrading bacteriocin [Burkholderia cepacia]NHB09165.1 lipid II-degrading bacteriocin [Burkholderia cepacia]